MVHFFCPKWRLLVSEICDITIIFFWHCCVHRSMVLVHVPGKRFRGWKGGGGGGWLGSHACKTVTQSVSHPQLFKYWVIDKGPLNIFTQKITPDDIPRYICKTIYVKCRALGTMNFEGIVKTTPVMWPSTWAQKHTNTFTLFVFDDFNRWLVFVNKMSIVWWIDF